MGDGTTKNTAAFAAAIAACHRAGGGHVIVPAGTFLTGAIHLLSNVDLHVGAGATVLFSQDPNDYLPVVFTRRQGIELSLETPDFNALEAMADAGTPVSQRVFGSGHFLPPQMIQPFASDTVLLEGVTVINSPFWHLNPNLCRNVTVDGLTIRSSGPWAAALASGRSPVRRPVTRSAPRRSTASPSPRRPRPTPRLTSPTSW